MRHLYASDKIIYNHERYVMRSGTDDVVQQSSLLISKKSPQTRFLFGSLSSQIWFHTGCSKRWSLAWVKPPQKKTQNYAHKLENLQTGLTEHHVTQTTFPPECRLFYHTTKLLRFVTRCSGSKNGLKNLSADTSWRTPPYTGTMVPPRQLVSPLRPAFPRAATG